MSQKPEHTAKYDRRLEISVDSGATIVPVDPKNPWHEGTFRFRISTRMEKAVMRKPRRVYYIELAVSAGRGYWTRRSKIPKWLYEELSRGNLPK